jgi:polynucleotide 5'-kinase involved in rRNA processing
MAAPERREAVVVAGPKGGTGKTAIPISLAEDLGRRLEKTGGKACHLDINIGQADGGATPGRFRYSVTEEDRC